MRVSRRSHHVRRFRAGQAFVLLLCLALAAYFGTHAVYGRHGLIAKAKLEDRLTALDFELDGLKATQETLERDVALLSTNPPHPDLVEEIARDVLGFAYPDERIVLAPQLEEASPR